MELSESVSKFVNRCIPWCKSSKFEPITPEPGQVTVSVVVDCKPHVEICSDNVTAEELCITLCEKYEIPPLTRTLFALRVRGTEHFLKDNSKVIFSSRDYELRIRYKVPRPEHLKTLDKTTLNYYYRQAHKDVYENKIPEIKYLEHKEELLALGIIDMALAVKEKKILEKDVIKSCDKYIPKIVVKKHKKVAQEYAHDFLPVVCSAKHDVSNLKKLYLEQLNSMAPNYLIEEFDDVYWQNEAGKGNVPVRISVAPFQRHEPGIKFLDKLKNEWIHVCTIENLIFLRRKGKHSLALELSRKGPSLSFTFKSNDQLSSFISLCDGYYRLMVKWIFNLSKDDETPSLKELQRKKCHGPVGGAFSVRKLEEKRAKKHGCYILRQSEKEYNVYTLDVCGKDSIIQPYRLEFNNGYWVFDCKKYSTIEEFISAHRNPEDTIFLNECIPPSEYDTSQLLLCADLQKTEFRIGQAELHEVLKNNRSPRCLSNGDIRVYTGSEKYSSENITVTSKALWQLDESRTITVAFKTPLETLHSFNSIDFNALASKWTCVQSSSLVHLYGLTFGSPTAMVLEYLPYGPFDNYLRENKDKIEPIHLKKVAAELAKALWDLTEAGVVHGYIRCRKLLVAAHEGDRIVVKLSGPSVRQYKPQDVHWMPVEFFKDMTLAKMSTVADIWAFATTLWEMFSYGSSPTETNPTLTVKNYARNERLPLPDKCPPEVWSLMRQCWQNDPLRPQNILRDMKHILHNEYVPSDIPLYVTEHGVLNGPVDVKGTVPSADFLPPGSSNSPVTSQNGVGYSRGHYRHGIHTMPVPIQTIVSNDVTYLISLEKKIGSGNYGDVFTARMSRDDKESQKRLVAVKKLNPQAFYLSKKYGVDEQVHKTFENELEIMKSLQHVNIVELLGYQRDIHGSILLIVMEYLEAGSLEYYLKSHGRRLQTNHLLQYALDIASGMDHISAKKIVHRDLATRNVLVVNDHQVKISDFGLSQTIPKEKNEYQVVTMRMLPINWYAPESAVKPCTFSTKSDVWSYGVTVWELFSRAQEDVPDFDTNRPLERASCFQIPDGCPSEIYRYLMNDCWNIEPYSRPEFIELVRWCKGYQDKYFKDD